jgi:hypothetical protein
MENLYRKINFDYIVDSEAKNLLNKDIIKFVLENYEKISKTTNGTILSELDNNDKIKESYILTNKEIHSIKNKDNYENGNKLQIVITKSDSKSILKNCGFNANIEKSNNFVDENTRYLIIENSIQQLYYQHELFNPEINKQIVSYIFNNKILFYKFIFTHFTPLHI